tara:strand:- start:31 stop:756 length:726 start_codon:yes stop_codon:yes gene_type:complete
MVKIEYTSTLEELLHIEELHPQPRRNFVPEWFKKIPADSRKYFIDEKNQPKKISRMRTVKRCPSFHEIFDEGLVIVAPCDIWISMADNNEDWLWESQDTNAINIEYHDNKQFRDFYKDKNIRGVFKLNLPWKFKTPKGYSIRQFPMHYSNNPDWEVAYGVVRTDIHTEVNVQLFYTSKENEILIKQGEPLCYIVPYKRENVVYELIKNDKKRTAFLKKSKVNLFRVHSTFKSGYHTLMKNS